VVAKALCEELFLLTNFQARVANHEFEK
jgi:hypothetical protein